MPTALQTSWWTGNATAHPTKFNDMSVEETYNSINTKINCGSFTFSFFLQCIQAIGTQDVRFN
ncbi:DUF6471 domain-containing protein [Methylomagnum ishizawai]|uniref:DUF6471 domain-containing protein n=1 Tax=Methylomagnum ishizawai TaxID=1760988 RepID=UPI001C327272|nr:DUF6471 domain-containing protein [Methylomagnum ishizawai]BBL75595.1 hypothetical protein MishRS11D_26930 [Methylomagnum ishizawai]